MLDISKNAIVKNGMDIADVFGRKDKWTEQIISSSVGYMHTAFVTWLNDNGFEQAGQALDDAWHDREDQWWRDEHEFGGRFYTGEEKRNQISGQES